MAETGVTVLIPALNEAAALPRLVAALERLEPKPAEILCIDGGSTDDTIAIAKAADWRMLDCEKGRAKQINFGVAEARGALVVVLHADTIPPPDMVMVVRETLADRSTALAGFTPLIGGQPHEFRPSLDRLFPSGRRRDAESTVNVGMVWPDDLGGEPGFDLGLLEAGNDAAVEDEGGGARYAHRLDRLRVRRDAGRALLAGYEGLWRLSRIGSAERAGLVL